MKISPDGSLPRITSSSKGINRHVKIVKVPDDEVKEGGLLYKLVWIGAVEHESESEKSEEELWSDDDVPDIQLPTEKMPNVQLPLENKEKANDVKYQRKSKTMNKAENEQERRYKDRKNNRYRTPHKRNNYNSTKRKFNTSGRLHKNYDKSNTNKGENNYKYFPNKQEFGAPNNFGRKYNVPINSDGIDPWIKPPTTHYTGSTFQYPLFPYPSSLAPVSVLEQTPPNHNAPNLNEKCNKSVGILGNSPYSPPHRPNFPPSIQNDNFVINQNYWSNTEYHEYPQNDYQRRPNHVHASVSASTAYKNNYYYQRNRNRHKRNNTRW